jgi:hypothetical protein
MGRTSGRAKHEAQTANINILYTKWGHSSLAGKSTPRLDCYGWIVDDEAALTVLAAAVKAAAAAPAPRLRGSSVAGAAVEDEAEAEETEEDDAATVGAWPAARGLGCAGGCGTSELAVDAACAGTIALIRCNVPAGCEDEA